MASPVNNSGQAADLHAAEQLAEIERLKKRYPRQFKKIIISDYDKKLVEFIAPKVALIKGSPIMNGMACGARYGVTTVLEKIQMPSIRYIQALDPEIMDATEEQMKKNVMKVIDGPNRTRVVDTRITKLAADKRCAHQVLYVLLKGSLGKIVEEMDSDKSKNLPKHHCFDKIRELVAKYIEEDGPVKYTIKDYIDWYRNGTDTDVVNLGNKIETDPEIVDDKKVAKLWTVLRKVRTLVLDLIEDHKVNTKKISKLIRAANRDSASAEHLKNNNPRVQAIINRLYVQKEKLEKEAEEWALKANYFSRRIEHYKDKYDKIKKRDLWYYFFVIITLGVFYAIKQYEVKKCKQLIKITDRIILDSNKQADAVLEEALAIQAEIENKASMDSSQASAPSSKKQKLDDDDGSSNHDSVSIGTRGALGFTKKDLEGQFGSHE